eukprot:CAMPEP_0206251108 /NCGR_PEP_ID=MMETSP0047_2-20121206/21845_1 /ASSEMBLY_ACC=CAM_ASM_000192 /TAXON_ID=195065 /ORGANISM="Chroomonas mesostigmatica_cf, Strain CCMP1168" /LENGTH=390 /DNA_ID=CAMNT_0053677033 /DNA_START=38 /DNA_END=1210 /DNA_ORIENTATION=-
MGVLVKVLGGVALISLTFVTLWVSGALAELGFFKYLAEQLPQVAGTTPAFVDKRELAEWATCDKIPEWRGKVALVTGANIGLGKATAMHLAACAKMKVIMGCRSAAKCDEAAMDIRKKKGVPADLLVTSVVDLSSLKSVNAFADRVLASESRLDTIIFNAGVFAPTGVELTEDDVEVVFAVNHLSHFLLWKRLAPLAEKTAEAFGDVRVVTTSSAAHYDSYSDGVGLSLGVLNSAERYNPMRSYGQSKLANLLFAQELSERTAGKSIYSNAVHPGLVASNFAIGMPAKIADAVAKIPHYGQTIAPFVEAVVTGLRSGIMAFGFTPEQGAIPQTYLATSRDVIMKNLRGKLVHPMTYINERPHAHARNATLQRALWDVSEEILVEKGFLPS